MTFNRLPTPSAPAATRTKSSGFHALVAPEGAPSNSNAARLSECIAPAFREVHADVKKHGHAEYWLKGGRGSTKSSFISLEIVLGILKNPGANAIVYRKVAATLRESVFEQMIWAIDKLGLREWFRMKISPMEITYKPTGQRILFRGADDPTKSKSIKLSNGYFGFVWFEELAEFRGMEDIRTIKASVIRGEGQTTTFYSYNPPVSARIWVNREAMNTRPDRLTHESCYLDVPEKWLGADFIAEAEALKATNERAYRHMYLGEVTGTGGNVFDNLAIRAITEKEIQTLGAFYNGLDFGFGVDPDAFTRWAYSPTTRTLYAVSEFTGIRNSFEKLSGEVKARSEGGAVRCDSADPRMIAELSARGVKALGVKKGAGSVEHGVRWLQDLKSIVIDPARTPAIAREFTGYEYAQDKNGDFIAEYPDKDNHTIDSCRYALETVIAQKRIKTMSAAALGL